MAFMLLASEQPQLAQRMLENMRPGTLPPIGLGYKREMSSDEDEEDKWLPSADIEQAESMTHYSSTGI